MDDAKILRVLEKHTAFSSGWWWVTFLFEHVHSTALEGEIPLGDLKTWSTYNNCVFVEISSKAGRIFLKYEIWNGDLASGTPTTPSTAPWPPCAACSARTTSSWSTASARRL